MASIRAKCRRDFAPGSECEFPDAYVDPYPESWANLLLYAEHGSALLTDLDIESPVLTGALEYFDRAKRPQRPMSSGQNRA